MVGDMVSKGSLIARVETNAANAPAAPGASAARAEPATQFAAAAPPAPPAPAARRETAGDTARMPSLGSGPDDRTSQEFNRSTQLLVLGAGPGGYTEIGRAHV